MLAEEVAVVAQEDDEGVVELALSRQHFQYHAHAFIDGSHHRGAQPDLLLADVQRIENGLCPRCPELEYFCPCRFLLHYLGMGQHVGSPGEHTSPVETFVPFRGAVPPQLRQIERAICCLDGIGMDRLMREEQRERLTAFPLQEIDGELV